MKHASLLAKVEELERARGGPYRYVIVATHPTRAQADHIERLEAEGYRVHLLADPYPEAPPRAA